MGFSKIKMENMRYKGLKELDDYDLVEKAKDKNFRDKAIQIFYERHKRNLNGFLIKSFNYSKEDREDIVQETLINFTEKIGKYKKEFSKPSTWFFKMAYNRGVDKFRRDNSKSRKLEKSIREIKFDESIEVTHIDYGGFKNPEEILIHKQKIDALDSAVKKLPQKYREIYNLVIKEELKYKEVQEKLDINENTLKSRKKRLENSLRNKISRK